MNNRQPALNNGCIAPTTSQPPARRTTGTRSSMRPLLSSRDETKTRRCPRWPRRIRLALAAAATVIAGFLAVTGMTVLPEHFTLGLLSGNFRCMAERGSTRRRIAPPFFAMTFVLVLTQCSSPSANNSDTSSASGAPSSSSVVTDVAADGFVANLPGVVVTGGAKVALRGHLFGSLGPRKLCRRSGALSLGR